MESGYFFQLLFSTILLLALVILFGLGFTNSSPSSNRSRLYVGIAVGAITSILMLNPLEIAPGIIVDARPVALGISGLFFPPLSTLVAMVMSGFTRFMLGGAATFAGILGILASGFIGIGARHLWINRIRQVGWYCFYGLGLVLSLVNMLILYVMHPELPFLNVLWLVGWVLVLFPLMTLLLSLLIVNRMRENESKAALKSYLELLRLSLANSGQNLFELDPSTGFLEINSDRFGIPNRESSEYQIYQDSSWLEGIHPDERPEIKRLVNDIRDGKVKKFSKEFRLFVDEENWQWIFASGQVTEELADGTPKKMLGAFSDITDRRTKEQELNILTELINHTKDGIHIVDLTTGRFLNTNLAGSEMLGLTREELLKLSVFDVDIMTTRELFEKTGKKLLEEPEGTYTPTFESVQKRKDGSTFPVEITLQMVMLGKKYCVATVRDITERKEAEEKLAKSQDELQLASLVYLNTSEGMMITDSAGRIIDVNPTFSEVTGYGKEEVIGKKTSILKSGRQSKDFYEQMWSEMINTGHWQGEIWNRRKNGKVYPELLTINAVYDDNDNVERWVAQFLDITAQKEAEELVWKHTNFDYITGLPNQHMLRDRLKQELLRMGREDKLLALLFLDLDHFKEVNESLGHAAGDVLLRKVTSRLKSCVRKSDTISRFSGDEFVIAISGLKSRDVATERATTILNELRKPIKLDGKSVYISASIGITIFPDDGHDIHQLLKNADQAMFSAKKAGRNRYQYFTKGMQVAVDSSVEVTTGLREALERDELFPVFQPIVDLKSRKVVKAEALVRWRHPIKGIISPLDFILQAEEFGLIGDIDNLMFEKVLNCLSEWIKEYPDLQVSVNSSPEDYRSKLTLKQNARLSLMRKKRVPGKNIVIEITENVLLDGNEDVLNSFMQYHDEGVQIALDDFGTGYSSLSYLKKFNIDYLKIDQSFVSHMHENEDDLVLCQAIISMAHKLGLAVVAEGIEKKEHLDLLVKYECDFGQGYYFSEPIPEEEFRKLLGKELS